MESLDAGTKVYKLYVYLDQSNWSINEGVVTDIVANGQHLVRYGSGLYPMGEGWRLTKTECKQDYEAVLVRSIVKMMASLDKLRDEILHETLATQEVASGVA